MRPELTTGQRFGRLVVLHRAPNKGARAAWHVRCDCGGETVVTGNHLRTGNTRSCGCLVREQIAAMNRSRAGKPRSGRTRLIDLTGDRYGRLAVISRAPNKGRRVAWHCRCDCGAERIIPANNLRRRHTLSCGCLSREAAAAMAKARRRVETGDTAEDRLTDYSAET